MRESRLLVKRIFCGCRRMAICNLPKVKMWVRFPSPAFSWQTRDSSSGRGKGQSSKEDCPFPLPRGLMKISENLSVKPLKLIRPEKKIVIVGAGFGGVRCALNLAKKNPARTKIILISDKPHFEYQPTLYRVATGRSPLEVCIPLREIFAGKNIEVVEDSIRAVNLKEMILEGESGSRYAFDFLVLALGSETAYFNVPGLKELSFGFKSISQALVLKKHLHRLFTSYGGASFKEKTPIVHLVIVGGGATGVELAGELAVYAKKLTQNHGFDFSLVTIELIEAASRLLPALPEAISEKVKKRLHGLGVNIFLNRAVIKEEIEQIFLKDMEIRTKTVIWTAGVRTHHLYSLTKGLTFDQKGRVLVNEFLQPPGFDNVFILGDAAATPYAGLAQTAIYDGRYAAKIISRRLGQKPLFSYWAKKPACAIPIGPGWAIVLIGPFRFFGRFGWCLRRLADLRFFLSILSFRKALLVFLNSKTLCESCAICSGQ